MTQYVRALLLACRGALGAVVAEPALENDVYEAFQRRLGAAERAQAEGVAG